MLLRRVLKQQQRYSGFNIFKSGCNFWSTPSRHYEICAILNFASRACSSGVIGSRLIGDFETQTGQVSRGQRQRVCEDCEHCEHCEHREHREQLSREERPLTRRRRRRRWVMLSGRLSDVFVVIKINTEPETGDRRGGTKVGWKTKPEVL